MGKIKDFGIKEVVDSLWRITSKLCYFPSHVERTMHLFDIIDKGKMLKSDHEEIF